MEEEDWEFPAGEEDIAEAKKKLCSRYHVEFQRREKRKAFIIIVKRLHTGGMHARLYRDLQRHNRRK